MHLICKAGVHNVLFGEASCQKEGSHVTITAGTFPTSTRVAPARATVPHTPVEGGLRGRGTCRASGDRGSRS